MHTTPRRLNDWEKCIICKVNAHSGMIRHLRTCPDYVQPHPGATSVSFGDIMTTMRKQY